MDINNICLSCMNAEYGASGLCPLCGASRTVLNQDHQLAPTSVLHGRYLIGRAIAQGGFGITYVGFDLAMQAKVAVKEFFPRECATRKRDNYTVLPRSDENLARFFEEERVKVFNEAQRLYDLRSIPNVVRVIEAFHENDTAYIVMEYAEGQTLKNYLRLLGGPMEFRDAVDLLEPVMKALTAIHRKGIVHRDVSPDNIMLSPNGPVLVDFGSARAVSVGADAAKTINVKVGFTPPEQYDTHGKQGPWTDVYALGATIYYAVTGVVPENSVFRVPNSDSLARPRTLNPNITEMEEAVLMDAMAIRVEDRFPDMTSFITALRCAVPQNPPQPEVPSEPQAQPQPAEPSVSPAAGQTVLYAKADPPEKKLSNQEKLLIVLNVLGMIGACFLLLLGLAGEYFLYALIGFCGAGTSFLLLYSMLPELDSAKRAKIVMIARILMGITVIGMLIDVVEYFSPIDSMCYLLYIGIYVLNEMYIRKK